MESTAPPSHPQFSSLGGPDDNALHAWGLIYGVETYLDMGMAMEGHVRQNGDLEAGRDCAQGSDVKARCRPLSNASLCTDVS